MLDLTYEIQLKIFKHLSPTDLCAVTCTCNGLNNVLTQGLAAEQIWQAKCEELLGEGLVALHKHAAVKEVNKVQFWRNLYRDATSLDAVRWWEEGSRRLKKTVEEADRRTVQEALDAEAVAAAAAAADNDDGLGALREQVVRGRPHHSVNDEVNVGSLLQSACQRSGHASVVVGQLVVATGGYLLYEANHLDVLILHLGTLTISRPVVHGTPPAARFRHTVVEVRNLQGSCLADLLHQEVGPSASVEGHVILMIGGYNSRGDRFGCNILPVLWVSRDGSRVHWLSLKTEGTCPQHLYHHTSNLFSGGGQVVVYGGEGFRNQWLSAHAAPPVYILHIATAQWTQIATTAPKEDCNPGLRTLHISTIRMHPNTGHEELVIVGGYKGNQLAAMMPFALDLNTYCWQRGKGLDPDSAPSVELPVPRQRAAGMKVGHDWLLVHGGAPAHGVSLDTLDRLHLPTLTWKAPPITYGEPAKKLSRIAGHTIMGGVAFGGFMATIRGLMPMAKSDVLLFGCGPHDNKRAPQRYVRSCPPGPSLPFATIPHTTSGRQGSSTQQQTAGPPPQVVEVMVALGGGLTVQLWKDIRTGQLHAFRPTEARQERQQQVHQPEVPPADHPSSSTSQQTGASQLYNDPETSTGQASEEDTGVGAADDDEHNESYPAGPFGGRCAIM